jgi:hypothetical protein
MYKPPPPARTRPATKSLGKSLPGRPVRSLQKLHEPPPGVRKLPRASVLLPSVPYPVFERLPEPPAADRDAADDTATGYDLTWSEPEPLQGATRAAGPGLFVVERRGNGAWRPVYVGMSGSGVGRALRWIVQAPAILNVAVAWTPLRARIATAGFDASGASGRAVLRRLRDAVVEAIGRTGARVAVSPGPAATGPAPDIRHLGSPPGYVASAEPQSQADME